jgi:uncharacterized protein (DUF934 family)
MHIVVASAVRSAYSVGLKTFGNEMTDAPPSPRLWTPDGFHADAWRRLAADEIIPAEGRVVLPLTAFLALDPSTGGADRFGVLVKSGEGIEDLVGRLPSVPLVALEFPAFNDGRSFSKASLLRTRHAYRGILRAVGDVLIDQIPLMLRTGFDQFEVSNPTALRRLEAGDLRGLPVSYQPASTPDSRTGSYSWRRRVTDRR